MKKVATTSGQKDRNSATANKALASFQYAFFSRKFLELGSFLEVKPFCRLPFTAITCKDSYCTNKHLGV